MKLADYLFRVAPKALYYAAFSAQQAKDFEKASQLAAEFLKSYAGNKFEADVRNLLAESELLSKNYEEAEKAFRELIAMYPQNEAATQWMVRCAQAMSSARPHCRRAASVAPPCAAARPSPCRSSPAGSVDLTEPSPCSDQDACRTGGARPASHDPVHPVAKVGSWQPIHVCEASPDPVG